MLVLVKNINGTSDNYPPHGYNTWKEFWIDKSGKNWPYYCVASRCYERAEVGAHVMLANGLSKRWYIVPLCKKHNKDGETFYVDDSYLVPVN